MTAVLIDGKKQAQNVREHLAEQILEVTKKPVLAVILVGDNPASQVYVRNKRRAAEEIGMGCQVYTLPRDVSIAELENLINSLNHDDEINGIIVQLPLPKHLDSLKVLELIDFHKDVDGFSPYNAGLLQMNHPDAVVAATPKGVVELLRNHVSLDGKHAVIIGRSNIVGRPLADLLLNNNCTVTVAHSHTRNLQELCQQADIIVAACGVPCLVKKDWVKNGAVVIDVGINRQNGKLVGDVDFNEVQNVVAAITPVPGGVGPMTVAMLLQNTWQAYLKQNTHS